MTVKPKMIETMDTSSSTVRPHLVQQQSRTYEEELPCNDESLLRFDLPWDMVNIVGLRWYETMRVIRDDHRLLFSILPLHRPEIYEYNAKRYFSCRNGNPKTDLLDETSDNVYTLLPKEFATQWKENDKVEYNLIRETEEDERHIEAKHSDYSG